MNIWDYFEMYTLKTEQKTYNKLKFNFNFNSVHDLINPISKISTEAEKGLDKI